MLGAFSIIREPGLVVHPRPSLIVPGLKLAAVVGHSVLDRKVWQVFPSLFVFVDLIAAEFSLRAKQQIGILRLL